MDPVQSLWRFQNLVWNGLKQSAERIVVVVVLIFWRFQSALTIYANLYGKILSFFYTFHQSQSICLQGGGGGGGKKKEKKSELGLWIFNRIKIP